MEHIPLPMEHIPLPMEHIPLPMEHIPLLMEHIPLPMEHIPLPMEHIPLPMEHIPLPMEHIPLPMEHIPLPMEHIPLPMEHIPLPMEYIPLLMEHIPLPMEYIPLLRPVSMISMKIFHLFKTTIIYYYSDEDNAPFDDADPGFHNPLFPSNGETQKPSHLTPFFRMLSPSLHKRKLHHGQDNPPMRQTKTSVSFFDAASIYSSPSIMSHPNEGQSLSGEMEVHIRGACIYN